MANLQFEPLKGEYAQLWASASVKPQWQSVCNRIAANTIANRARYEAIQEKTGVPWYWIGATHSLESSQRFNAHLHNGDPLTERTRQIPRNRPATGNPPFTFEESAIDALTMPPHSLHLVKDWSIERLLYEAERYNGWGYRYKGVPSAYVWSFTNQYVSGKYIADGVWSSTHVSTQCGFAAILKTLLPMIDTKDDIPLSDAPIPKAFREILRLGSKGALVKELQTKLGGLVVDGDFGPKTERSVKDFQKKHALHVDGVVGFYTWGVLDA